MDQLDLVNLDQPDRLVHLVYLESSVQLDLADQGE